MEVASYTPFILSICEPGLLLFKAWNLLSIFIAVMLGNYCWLFVLFMFFVEFSISFLAFFLYSYMLCFMISFFLSTSNKIGSYFLIYGSYCYVLLIYLSFIHFNLRFCNFSSAKNDYYWNSSACFSKSYNLLLAY